jgi:hypothetical protein
MTQTIAVKWSGAEAQQIDEAIERLLRGRNRAHDREARKDFLDVLRGIPAAHVLDGIERMRASGRPFVQPGDVREAALMPVESPPRAERCRACRYHMTACICSAIAEQAEDHSADIARMQAELDALFRGRS